MDQQIRLGLIQVTTPYDGMPTFVNFAPKLVSPLGPSLAKLMVQLVCVNTLAILYKRLATAAVGNRKQEVLLSDCGRCFTKQPAKFSYVPFQARLPKLANVSTQMSESAFLGLLREPPSSISKTLPVRSVYPIVLRNEFVPLDNIMRKGGNRDAG